MDGILNYVKRHLNLICYIAAGVLTAVIAISLIVWSVNGEKEQVATVLPAEIVCENGICTEYLVGQKFKTDGVFLNVGTEENPELIPAENCTVNADFSSAGQKLVEIVYKADDFLSYRASVNAEVIFVRSMEIAAYPSNIEVESAGKITADDGFKMFATLAAKPKTDAFGEAEETENGYRIKLGEEDYTVSCVADSKVKNFYTATFYCGNVSSVFSFYNAAGRSFIVSSVKDVVPFTAEEGEGAALTLIVTDKAASYQNDCTGTTKGYYVYSGGEGVEVLDFNYELTDKEELLKSEKVTESFAGNVYTAEVNGKTFKADAAIWQSAVVNGNIIDDHGFKLVVDSQKRVLNYSFVSQTDSEGNKTEVEGAAPTLTLYTTEYDINPLLGTGNGFARGVYIFTDSNGYSYKLKFHMNAYVWTYVPDSNGFNDILSDVTVDWDYVYNPSAPPDMQYDSYYRGDLYARISVYSRGEGFKTVTLMAPEAEWLGAVMGM